MYMLVAQQCLTLCDPMDYSPPGSFVHGIPQARVLEWVAIPFSRRSSWLSDWTWVSYIADRFFTVWTTISSKFYYFCFVYPGYQNHLYSKAHQSVSQSVSQFSRSVVSDSLWPHESQHARPPCPSPTPGVHSDSRPSSQWCHPAISSSVIPFYPCPQSLPASESFPMSQLFA